MLLRFPALVTGLRRLGESRAGARFGERAYRVAARVAAARLARVPGVLCVFLSGSLSRRGHLNFGYSDIDFVLVVELPTLDSELAFREALRRAADDVNGVLPLFTNIDYIEHRDLERYALEGDLWSLDLDARWERFGGVDVSVSARRADRGRLVAERLVRCLRRWAKASGNLLDETAGRSPSIVGRGARRVLGDALAVADDESHLDPIETRFEAAGIAESELATPSRCMALALAAHERAAAREAATWKDEYRLPAPDTRPPGAAFERFVKGALDVGFDAVLLAERSPGDCVFYAVTAPDESPLGAVLRMQRLLAREGALPPEGSPWSMRPAVVTPRLLRAGALFEPNLDGDTRVSTWGRALESIPQPPPDELARLRMARRLASLVRARGRAFRLRRSPERALADLVRDVERLEGREATTSERELVRRMRERYDEIRRGLASSKTLR